MNVSPEGRYFGRIRAVAEDRAPTVRPRNSSAAMATAFHSISRATVWPNAPTFPTNRPPIAFSASAACLGSSSATRTGKIPSQRNTNRSNDLILYDLVAFSKTPRATDKTIAGTLATKPIAPATPVSSGHCISNSFRCDTDPDCPDASDEMGCPQPNCTTIRGRHLHFSCK